MTHIVADRVMETSTTTGTGTYTLAGAVSGYQSFAAIGDGNTCEYTAMDVDGDGVPDGDWERGRGTYTASGTTLARTVVLRSSNSNNAVNWAAGTRRIFLSPTAPLTGSVTALVGLVNYAPATNTIFSVASTTFAAMDTSNLRVTFTAPASGRVLVRLTAYADYNSAGNIYYWGLLSGASAVTGSGGIASRIITQGAGMSISLSFAISGLTAGTSYQWDWAHATDGSGTGRMLCGPGMTNTTSQTDNAAPAVMEVWSA